MLASSRQGGRGTCRAGGAATARRCLVRCSATAPSNQLLATVVETLFNFPPIFRWASANARKMILQRGETLGLDFAAEIEALKQVDWEAELAAVVDPAVVTPDYYRQPFHAYPQGNLSVEAALEVMVAAKSVHATVMDPSGKILDPQGDDKLRWGYSACMAQLLQEQGVRPPTRILDVGAATGLSSLKLLDAFSEAEEVVGIDLSPHFLAVGRYMQRQREGTTGHKERLSLVHAAAESTGLPDASFDLVSLCLVCHELPEHASFAIFKEAFRLLRPGGAMAIMEMNPASEALQRVLKNPVPYAIFKSTEPYLQEYIAMDAHAALQAAGFQRPRQLENSPRHRTIVAVKPVL